MAVFEMIAWAGKGWACFVAVGEPLTEQTRGLIRVPGCTAKWP